MNVKLKINGKEAEVDMLDLSVTLQDEGEEFVALRVMAWREEGEDGLPDVVQMVVTDPAGDELLVLDTRPDETITDDVIDARRLLAKLTKGDKP